MEILTFTVDRKDWSTYKNCGVANGYACINKRHPLFGKAYSTLVKVKSINKIRFNGNYFGLFINAGNKQRRKNEISVDSLVDVHGGITFAESGEKIINGWGKDNAIAKNIPEKIKLNPKNWWVFGFDTAHCDDNSDNWNKKAVEDETKRFAENLKEVCKIIIK